MNTLPGTNLRAAAEPETGQSENGGHGGVIDIAYRKLLGPRAWARVKPEVRQRFSVRPGFGKRIRYRGVRQTVKLSTMGWLFAQLCRLIGTPLAPCRGKDVRMDIELTWNEALQGVTWLRCYHFPRDRNYTVRSTKRHGPEGDLIEDIGRGFSMRLALSEQDGNLVFTSTRYEVKLAGRQFCLPRLLTPGTTTVRHEQIAGDRFRFSISVDHPILGRTIFQQGEFYSLPASER